MLFFDFFMTAPSKTYTFESISGGRSFRNALKSRCFRRSCHEQVEKNIAPERHDALKRRAWQQNQAIWNSSADPADPDYHPDQVAGAAARTLPSTRAGGQDDGSYTNSLKLCPVV